MEKTNFWNDAAKWGAVMALVQIVFTTAGLFWRSSLLSLVSVAVFVVLLFFFTKRRVLLYGRGENGYGYGQCMKYIFWMMCFSGVLIGAWEIVALRDAARREPEGDGVALQRGAARNGRLDGADDVLLADLGGRALGAGRRRAGLLFRIVRLGLHQAGRRLGEACGGFRGT